MSFTNTVILQIIVFYCLVIALRQSPTVKSLRVSALGTPIAIGLCSYFLPRYAIFVGLGLSLPLILLPILLMRHLNALLAAAEFERAGRFARGLRWLVPTDGMWVYPQILQGMAWWQKNEHSAAEELLSRYRNDRRLMPRSAIALSYRLADRWAEYLVWADHQMSAGEIELDRSPIRTYYLRALGETGDLSKLLTLLDRSPHTNDLMLLRLQTLAFCGRAAAVAQLCPVVLRSSPTTVSEFWLGTAELAAGQGAARLHYLQSDLSGHRDSYLQQDLNWRLHHALPHLQQLNADDGAIIDRIEVAALQEIDQGQWVPAQAFLPATNFLVWLNVGVFVAEAGWKIFSPTEQLPWIAWGGLIAPLVMHGEWWRLVSANFLHLNFIHLLMNMLGLNYLGKFVEHRLGTFWFMVAYLATGLGAMVCVTYADLLQSSTIPAVTAGASGAIMGLLGVMGAIYLVSWWRHQTTTASRELQSIGVAVGLQLLFDITNGHTSIVGHFSGLAIGLVVGLVLASIKINDRLPKIQ
jgi:rhomboid protease GluP